MCCHKNLISFNQTKQENKSFCKFYVFRRSLKKIKIFTNFFSYLERYFFEI